MPLASVCVNGVSLTLVSVDNTRFSVYLIQFSLENTAFGVCCKEFNFE